MAYRMLWTQTYITHVDHNRSKSLITLVFMITINPFSPLMINWYSCRKFFRYRFALYRFDSMGASKIKGKWQSIISFFQVHVVYVNYPPCNSSQFVIYETFEAFFITYLTSYNHLDNIVHLLRAKTFNIILFSIRKLSIDF